MTLTLPYSLLGLGKKIISKKVKRNKLSLLLYVLIYNRPIMLGLCERLRLSGGQGVTGCGIRLCFFLSLERGINILSSGWSVCLEKMYVDFYQFSSFPWYCPFLPWIYKDSKSIPKSRFCWIIIATKWHMKRNAALWISGIYSYLLCSNMIKSIGDVPSMWLNCTDNSNFFWMWVCIITWCREKLQLWVVSMLFPSAFGYIYLLWHYTICLFRPFHYSGQFVISVLSFFGSCETENPKYIFQA